MVTFFRQALTQHRGHSWLIFNDQDVHRSSGDIFNHILQKNTKNIVKRRCRRRLQPARASTGAGPQAATTPQESRTVVRPRRLKPAPTTHQLRPTSRRRAVKARRCPPPNSRKLGASILLITEL